MQEKVFRRITKLNELILFANSTWEQAFDIHFKDHTGEFSDSVQVIMQACKDLSDVAMLEASKIKSKIK